ncbi:transporter substrate-binding domain-containing protein [Rubellicoccus peritrichatus]|uniref:Transporter substrate-binding domain-containing protein n=1 Tax=Rubellicoccus peritrichatus TaxID=3080537 RepID=A0AAQ3LCA8_9BACT|nr:transporter substrate-binding domain-containing protein [Puniceicoccus sp. CR14]WOO41797.1 transporter substrate-binding domain-containing protein [Puniceicoccus sp. CR14]
MRNLIIATLLFLTTCFTANSQTGASNVQSDTTKKDDVLLVATRQAPPFSFIDENGRWTGITIELWEAIAAKLNVKYEYKDYNLSELLKAVETGEADIGAAAITITAERVKKMDFTHTYFGEGLGIATTVEREDIWTHLASTILTWNFAKALLALITILLIAGLLIWLVERKNNPEQFGGRMHHGLGNGFWWSAVTMTTVGYGDKAPVTVLGRFIGLVWMFTSIIIISGFTGAIATALTVGQLEPAVTGPQDLPNVKVGVLKDSSGEEFLEATGLKPINFNSVDDGLKALQNGEIKAFVHDKPILVYSVDERYINSIKVLEHSFDPGFIGLALPLESKNLKETDLALLEFVQTPAWDAILKKYGVD